MELVPRLRRWRDKHEITAALPGSTQFLSQRLNTGAMAAAFADDCAGADRETDL